MSAALRILTVLTLFLAFNVNATVINQTLNFAASTQSLWGSGGSSDFGASGSGGFGPVGFSYNIGASTGTVSGQVEGDILINYTPMLTSPGATAIDLGFMGGLNRGRLKSDLGAWVEVDGDFDLGPVDTGFNIIDEGYSLNIDKIFQPKLDQTVSANDSTTIGGTGLNVFFAEVGADFDIAQTDNFEATAIDGTLAYQLRGSVITSFIPFMLDKNDGLSLGINLDELGIWDFWFVDIALENLFSTSFDAELVIWENHRGCGILGSSWCGRNSHTLADIDVYDGDPFALNFPTVSTSTAFSIQVGSAQVLEPSSFALLMLGIVGLGCRRSKAS